MKIKEHKSIAKVVIILIALILITMLSVYIYIKNNSTNVSLTSKQNSPLVETNNGYKTFSFTVDDILEAYGIDIKDTSNNSVAPYCIEHSGTVCLSLPIETQYMNMSIVYEKQSRKIISIEAIQPHEKGLDYVEKINATIDEFFVSSNKYLIANIGSVFKAVGKYNDFYEAIQNNPQEAKFFMIIAEEGKISKNRGGVGGFYQIVNDNIGTVYCYTEKEKMIRVIASDKEEFYDLSVNSLTNLEVSNILKKVNRTEMQKSIENKQTSNIPERISLSDIGTYTAVDYNIDADNIYNSRKPRVLKIYRIRPEENKEKYPEFFYTYIMNVPKRFNCSRRCSLRICLYNPRYVTV